MVSSRIRWTSHGADVTRTLLAVAGVLLGLMSAVWVSGTATVFAQPGPVTCVGKVANSDAYIGVVVNGNEVSAYVCDGRTCAD